MYTFNETNLPTNISGFVYKAYTQDLVAAGFYDSNYDINWDVIKESYIVEVYPEFIRISEYNMCGLTHVGSLLKGDK